MLSIYTLPKSSRLLTKADFDLVFTDAKSFRDRKYTLLVRKSDQETARIGFILAKKKVRLSVDRNRIRRVVRESFRHWRAELPIVDMIFISQPGLASMPNLKLFPSLDKQWSRIISTMPK
ncbi:MAG: ribonuclease P protein component [Thiothrix sp.]|nr:MAG: ribonuclease P protein component [Thiothrix sp.]